MVNLYPSSCVKHLSILGADHASGVMETQTMCNNFSRCSFKFNVKWLLDKELLDLVRSVWSVYINGSYAYQPLRKMHIIKQEIKIWKT